MRAGASMAGGANAAWTLGKAASGGTGWRGAAAGAGGVAQGAASSAWQSAKSSASRAFGNPGEAFEAGSRAAFTATGGKVAGSSAVKSMVPANAAPEWAQKLRREQGLRDAGLTTTHVISSGDRGGSADAPRLRQDDE